MWRHAGVALPARLSALAVALVACSGDPASGTQDSLSTNDSRGATATSPLDVAGDATTAEPGETTDATAGETSPADFCPPCLDDGDCSGAVCIQAGVDTFCAPVCLQVGTQSNCDAGRTCTITTTSSGGQSLVCLPHDGPCSLAPDTGTSSGAVCGTLVGPDVEAKCYACRVQHETCQANGCFGGWWCNTASDHCQGPPASCAGDPKYEGGAPVTGTVTPQGGSLSRLYFAVVGDTRPSLIDDTAGYPTNIITAIYDDLEALSPRPPLAVATGDYIFAKKFGAEAAPQLDLYLGARAHFSGAFFPALGNHECSGYTVSNCGDGNVDGTPTNYDRFVDKMLAPLGKTLPYYTVRLDSAAIGAPEGAKPWSAKLVFVAANAWDQTQADWLEAELAKDTTYTFVIRHEPKAATTAPGTTPSEAIMARHPLTLAITGHSHTYGRSGQREIIVGNGGAPSTGSKNFGFAIINQQTDGTLDVDMIDFTTGVADPSFHFRLNPDGTNAP